MNNIPEFNIELSQEETRLNLPGPILEKLEPWLKFYKVDYRIVRGDDIPDDWEQGWTFRGTTGTRHTVVIISKLNSKQLLDVAEQLMECTDEQLMHLDK